MAAARTNRNSENATTSVVQIVAHPDDDLYFLNPDLSADLARGTAVVSVCVTCGETDGKNAMPDEPGFADLPVDFAGYSGARQTGLMHAYARMAGLSAQSAWRREKVQLVPGIAAEHAVLVARPNVELIFLNLWQDASRSPEGVPGRPRQLWSGEIERIPTLPPTDSAAVDPGSYTRGQLIDALHAVLVKYRPTTVRIMDPDPDYQTHDADHRQHADYGDYSDHQDHTAVALFATAAIQRYSAEGPARPFSVVAYRGYYNERWPHNLTSDAFAAKAGHLAVYGWADGHRCPNSAGCGDRKVGDMAPGTHWGQSMTYRNPVSTSKAILGDDRRLRFFAVVGGRAAAWTQREPGGEAWSGPELLPGGDLNPELTAVLDATGRILLFGIETVLGRSPAEHRRNIVVSAQQEPGGDFGPWESLGNPHDGGNPWRLRGIGVPVAVRRGDDAVQVFVRNYGAGVSSRIRERDAQWGPWLDLGGSDTQDGLSAAVLGDGRVELAAATRRGVLRWFQDSPSGGFSRELLRTEAPVAPPTLVAAPDGGARLLLRRTGGTDVVMYTKPGPDADWDLRGHVLGGAGGVGRVATAVSRELLVAVKRDDDGRASALVVEPDVPAPARWRRLRIEPVTCPVVAMDATGPLALSVGLDGTLLTVRLPHVADRGIGTAERLASARRSIRATARGLSRRISAPRHAWKPAEIEALDTVLDPRPASHVQIIAHADDDLYFMNPDLLNAVRAGDRITTLVLCAGEADGFNATASADRHGRPDFEGYAAARATGLRRAYAAMATGDPDAPWDRREEKLEGGVLAEIAQLSGRPEITLAFFALRILGAPHYRPALRMRNLWNSSVHAMHTLVPTGSPVSAPCEVTRGALISAITQLLDRARPTTVRILDPDPECLDFSPEGETTFKDHLDHTMSAYFALEALRELRRRDGSTARSVAVESYRGYLNRELPHGLTAIEWAEKKNYLDLYGAADRPRGVSGRAIGDRKVGDRADRAGYGYSTTLRYPSAVPWAVSDRSGASHAFAIVDGAVRKWSAPAGAEPGTGWQLTHSLSTDAHLTDLTIAAGPEAIHLIAARMEIVARYDSQVRELVTASAATGAHSALEGWSHLAGPHEHDHPVKRHGLGAPALLADPVGGLHLFVRNFGTGLSAIHRDGAGNWSEWQDLRGYGLTGSVSVARSTTGRVHIIGTTVTGFIHWVCQDGAAEYEQSRVLGNLPAAPVGAPALAALDDGDMVLLSRVSGSGTLLCWRYSDGSGWDTQPRDLGGQGGHGGIAALWDRGALYIAVRNRRGSVSTSRVGEPEDGQVVWHPTGGLILRSPAFVADGVDTRPSLVALGADARLYSAGLKEDGAATAWSAADE